MAFHFYYDESEHSRKINLKTITADNYYDNFTAVIVGWESKDEKNIEDRYLAFEKKYDDRKQGGELKSSAIKSKQIRYGFASLNDENVSLVSDFLSIFDEKIYVYFCVSSKVEYIVRQVFAGYENNIFLDADAFKYTIIKAIVTYRPEDVMKCIYSDTSGLIEKLKAFLASRIEMNTSNPELKSHENQAFQEAICILDDAGEIKHEQWDYHPPFVGFKLYLTEQSIDDYSLVIDREGEKHNTLNAAKECNISNAEEKTSDSTVGIRIADMLAGLISKFMRSLSVDLRGSSGTEAKKILLPPEWFKLDDRRLSLYKKLYYVIMELHDVWYKSYAGLYPDDLVSFTSLLAYMNQFKNADEIAVDIDMHSEYFNAFVCERLQGHFIRMRNKLPVEPLPHNSERFFYNQRGAKIFYNINEQPMLSIHGSATFDVLSVGLNLNMTPMVTVLENNNPVCYRLSLDLKVWAESIVGMANKGMNLFPAKVRFTCKNGNYYADIL